MSIFTTIAEPRGIRWAEHQAAMGAHDGMLAWGELGLRSRLARVLFGSRRLAEALLQELRSSVRRIGIAIARWLDPWAGIPGHFYLVRGPKCGHWSRSTADRNACIQAARTSWGELSPADALLVLEGWSLAERLFLCSTEAARIELARAWSHATSADDLRAYIAQAMGLMLAAAGERAA